MDTSKLKSFAPSVRKRLHEAVGRKLDFVLAAQTPDLRTTYEKQVASLREKSQKNRKALIEEAAYTWFNRLTALRYLDAQGWHPFNAKILMPGVPGETEPEILKMVNAGTMPEELKSPANHRRIMDLLNRNIPSQNPEQEAYRHLVLGACRFYHATLPSIFAKVDDETELLLPDDLLGDLSIAAGFRTEIQDADCDDVEVIGWLYQFYISDYGQEVRNRKSAVLTEDIPSVTQLFTPHWIVRYLVENSLGRLWLLNRPASGLKAHMPYYIEGDAETNFLKITKPEEIKLVDPAVGSGHILTYAFDLLYLIYEEEGYPASDIPGLIFKHNLHGVEICPRAAQLAELALAFKARKKARRFFQPGIFVRPQITELKEIRFNGDELRDYIKELKLGALFDQGVIKLLHQFAEAKNFGALIEPCINEQSIANIRSAVREKDTASQLFINETNQKVLRVLDQAQQLTKRYHVVVANPPYMGWGNMNSEVRGFLEDMAADFKTDLFSAFAYRASTLGLKNGVMGFMTPNVWLYISSYEKMRAHLLNSQNIKSLIELPLNGFEGATVQICAFTFCNQFCPEAESCFIALLDFQGAEIMGQKALEAIGGQGCSWKYWVKNSQFKLIPGSPIAYRISDRLRNCFTKYQCISNVAEPRKGMVTADNPRFTRLWHEVSAAKMGTRCSSRNEAIESKMKWFPYQKGGDFRKWSGNTNAVINWENDGYELLHMKGNGYKVGSTNHNLDYIFKPAIVWTKITSGDQSFRVSGPGFLFDDASGLCAPNSESMLWRLAGLLNSSLSRRMLNAVNPTLNLQPGNLRVLPFAEAPVDETVKECCSISQADWDSFEASWGFTEHPILKLKSEATLEDIWSLWVDHCMRAIHRMQELETENNRRFIEAYGLQGELQPEVPEDQITLARADAKKDMAAFLSYAVGCMMGRYSLDKPGLILADAGDTLEQYLAKVGKSKEQLKFQPDDDGILPVMDVEWFEDDIVSRFEAFLVATFGADKLTENIQFIEKSIGDDIRSYFLGGFYKDHLQTYKKRPIYWMAQSPRKAFCALIYLHRYTKDTLSLLLNSYLRPYIVKLNSRIEILAQNEVSAGTAREKTAARKELEKLRKYVRECQEWERDVLLPAAQSRIDLDLDDGVKVNYLKLGDVLTPIPGLATKEDE